MEEIRVQSWAELHEQLFADSWHEGLGRHRSNFAFRGRWDAGDDLSTNLLRAALNVRLLEVHARTGSP